MEENDKGGLLEKVRYVGERLMEVGGEVSRLGSEASHAVEDGVAAARRFARGGRTATEDLIDDADSHIRKEPLRYVGSGCVMEYGTGALANWCAPPALAQW